MLNIINQPLIYRDDIQSDPMILVLTKTQYLEPGLYKKSKLNIEPEDYIGFRSKTDLKRNLLTKTIQYIKDCKPIDFKLCKYMYTQQQIKILHKIFQEENKKVFLLKNIINSNISLYGLFFYLKTPVKIKLTKNIIGLTGKDVEDIITKFLNTLLTKHANIHLQQDIYDRVNVDLITNIYDLTTNIDNIGIDCRFTPLYSDIILNNSPEQIYETERQKDMATLIRMKFELDMKAEVI